MIVPIVVYMNDIIEEVWEKYNYPSVDKLYKLLKDEKYDIKRSDITNYLNSKVEVQLLKETKDSKKKLGHITSFKPNSVWNMDIFYLQKYYKSNHGYKYILCCIDIFTRFVYCEPMKTKEIDEVINAFYIIIRKTKPYVIVSDSDSTFLSNEFQKMLNKNEIALNPVPLHDHHSLGIIDRFARTIKTILHKRFIKYNDKNWVDYLPKIIQNYNNSPHSSLDNIKPNEAQEPENASVIYDINIEKSKRKTTYKPTTFNVDDYVRIKITDKFAKKSEGKYQDEVYQIKSITGKIITLDNDVKVKYDLIQKVSKPIENAQPKIKNFIKKAKKEYQTELLHKKIEIKPENILDTKRIRKPNLKYK